MKNIQTILKQKGYYAEEIDGIIGPKSLEAVSKYVADEIKKRNWIPVKTGLVYIRLDQSLTNTFDDVVVRFNNGVVDRVAPCSTTAGDYWLFNPITYGGVTGTAIAAEQQVIGSHKFVTSGSWKSLWLGAPYFQQVKPIKIYRDGNKNRILDKIITQIGLFGINLHRAGLGSLIDRWSAGCMVVPDKFWFDFISIFVNGQEISFNLFEV